MPGTSPGSRPITPAPSGAAHDEAFARAVLGVDGDVLMRARQRGTGGRIDLEMTMEVQGGTIRPAVTLEHVNAVLGDLPPLEPMMKHVRLRVDRDEADARMTSDGWGDVRSYWDGSRTDGLRNAWNEHVRSIGVVSAQALYKALAAGAGSIAYREWDAEGISVRWVPAGEPDLAGAGIQANFHTRGGEAGGVRLYCSLQVCAVGPLAPFVTALQDELGSGAAHATMDIAPTGQVRIQVSPTDGRAGGSFEARLDEPDVRPCPARR